jgi:2'-5' RNA ligase
MAAGGGLTAAAPLVLTLEMDGQSFARLDALRRRYYPPERNAVPAHITLFHTLPGERGREIEALLRALAASRKSFEAQAAEVKTMERGVAVFLRSPQLHALRDELAAEWEPWLAEQDRAGFRPHVTLQNNVSAAAANETRRAVAAELRPFTLRALGLHLWRYRERGWEDVRLFRFR